MKMKHVKTAALITLLPALSTAAVAEVLPITDAGLVHHV